MALNDDVLNELDDTVIDHDIVNPPSVADKTQTPITIVAKTSDVSEDVTRLTPEQASELVKFDVDFELIREGASKIVELEDVEKNIVAQESISRNDAEYVEQSFKGLFTDRLTIEQFTNSPSKANYVDVKKFMRSRIAQETQSIYTVFREFLDKPLLDAKVFVERIRDELFNHLRDGMMAIKLLSDSLTKDLLENKNLVIPLKDGTFVNIANIDLAVLNLEDAVIDNFDASIYSKAISNLRSVFNVTAVKAFVLSNVDGKQNELSSAISIAAYSDRTITLLDIAKFYEKDSTVDYLSSLLRSVEEAVNSCNSFIEKSDDCKDNPETIIDFLIDSNANIQQLQFKIKTLCEIVTGLSHINLNALKLLELAKKF